MATSGLVNRDRAIRAAELSRTLDLTRAIAQAKIDILAPTTNDKAATVKYHQIPKEFVMSLPSPINFSFSK